MRWPEGVLRSPTTGLDLVADRAHSLTDGRRRYPVVDRIPVLGADPELTDDVLAFLDAGHDRLARLRLLGSDDLEGPVAGLLSGDSTLGMALDVLGLDDDATRHHSWLLPEHLAEVALLAARLPGAPALVLGADVGALAQTLSRAGISAIAFVQDIGLAWCLRRYVAPQVLVAVVDASQPLPIGDGSVSTAIVRTPWTAGGADLDLVVAEATRVASTVMVSGPRRVHEAMAADADGVLVGAGTSTLSEALLEGRRPVLKRWDALRDDEAILHTTTNPAIPGPLDMPPPGATLRRNPLLLARPGLLDGMAPAWPRTSKSDVVAAHLLRWNAVQLSPELRKGAVAGESAEIDRLTRQRILVDLPVRW